MLNARDDAREAEIIAQAGHGRRVTVATALAGRVTLASRVAMLGLCAPMLTRLAEALRGALS